MCEFCFDGWSEEEKVAVKEGSTCEFSTEQSPTACGAPARWRLRERVVDDHYCESHAQSVAADLRSDFMEVLQEAGVSQGETLKPTLTPIVAEVACDEEGCRARAKYANLTMTTFYFCDRHRNYGGDL